MPTTIEKFVFEVKNPYDDCDDAPQAPPDMGGMLGGVVQDFPLNADSRIVHVKITNAGAPAFYAMVDDAVPMVTRRMAAFPSRCALPPNWVYVGTACNGRSTFHIGEVIVTN